MIIFLLNHRPNLESDEYDLVRSMVVIADNPERARLAACQCVDAYYKYTNRAEDWLRIMIVDCDRLGVADDDAIERVVLVDFKARPYDATTSLVDKLYARKIDG